MSQKCVEVIIGRIATDEKFRRRFLDDPEGALEDLVVRGVELTLAERRALLETDPDAIRKFADAIDPRIQKCDLGCPGSVEPHGTGTPRT